MLARDVMTTEVITVHQEEKLKEVARILMDNKISGLPVVDDAHHVVGIILHIRSLLKVSSSLRPLSFCLS